MSPARPVFDQAIANQNRARPAGVLTLPARPASGGIIPTATLARKELTAPSTNSLCATERDSAHCMTSPALLQAEG
jgi:hypothetical protein